MKIGFIGMGNMASAIVHGVISSGFVSKDDIYGYDIDTSKLADIHACNSEIDVVKQVNIVFMAVKPYIVESVLDKIKDALKNKALVSIALGYDYDRYVALLDASTRHLTIMPNTPLLVQSGMTLFESKHSLNDEEYQYIFNMFQKIGEVEVLLPHEFKAGGSLSGCGPAFIYMVIEALADGAVAMGLSRAKAYKLASQTVLGAGKMQLETSLHPGILKDQVCSPGGSTIKGVKVLEENRLRYALIDAIKQSTN